MKKNRPWLVAKLIAHRGASALAPENTLAALEKAYQLGATWVEADVRLTLDGEAIIFHDAELSRCTNGRGAVGKTPYATIADLDAGSWFDSRFAGEPVPTLDQWLEAAAKRGLGVILDLKGKWPRTKVLADHVSRALSQHYRGDLPRPLISSESPACLCAVAAQQMDWDLAYILRKDSRGWQKVVGQLHCVAVHLDHQFISERWLRQLKNLGLHIAAYTVNDRIRAEQLFGLGVDSLFTDDPHVLTSETGH